MPPQGAYWDTPLLDSDPPIIGRPPSRGRPRSLRRLRPSGLGGQGLRSWCAFTVLKHLKVHFSLGPVDTKSKIPQCLRRHAERGTGPRSTVPFEYRPESPSIALRYARVHDSRQRSRAEQVGARAAQNRHSRSQRTSFRPPGSSQPRQSQPRQSQPRRGSRDRACCCLRDDVSLAGSTRLTIRAFDYADEALAPVALGSTDPFSRESSSDPISRGSSTDPIPAVVGCD